MGGAIAKRLRDYWCRGAVKTTHMGGYRLTTRDPMGALVAGGILLGVWGLIVAVFYLAAWGWLW
jgi:hypothetical protein